MTAITLGLDMLSKPIIDYILGCAIVDQFNQDLRQHGIWHLIRDVFMEIPDQIHITCHILL